MQYGSANARIQTPWERKKALRSTNSATIATTAKNSTPSGRVSAASRNAREEARRGAALGDR